jgi:hypothetical protein
MILEFDDAFVVSNVVVVNGAGGVGCGMSVLHLLPGVSLPRLSSTADVSDCIT